ncbi:MAG: SusC/RagA family TonB-linked outer membrane protein [Ferruginibacter sp.]|nr:SusC/RagA family TonB-linked outer membrane protein [Ferruginibacter sp.]
MIKHYLKKVFLLQFFLLVSCILFAQQKTVTGKVTDASGSPIPGVTVGVKGTNTNVQTDANGNYSIVVPSNQSVLKFSSASMLYEEQNVGTRTTISIAMEKNNQKLDDVVVVGYGTKKRVNVQGSVYTLKAAEIEDLPVANLGSALVNRIPGVSVNYSSGKPGSTTSLTIRNSTTLTNNGNIGATNQPLYVIDGIIVNPTIWAQSGNPDFFENLDASQIEDITFLKDASAAIYGAAGAKGVVLITTKKGKIGKPKITYSGYMGVSTPAVATKTLTAYEHAKMLNDGYELSNATVTSRFTAAELEQLKQMPDRNWFDQLWKNGKVMRHNINMSGGSEKFTFFAGGSYYNEKGNFGDNNIDKYSIRAGVDAKIIDGLTAAFSVSTDNNVENRGTHKNSNDETEDLSTRALYLTPKWVPLTINGIPATFNGPNPPGNFSMQGLLNSGTYKLNKSLGLSVNANIEYKPKFVPGLVAKVQYGKLNRNSFSKEYYESYQAGNFYKNVAGNGLLYTDSLIGITNFSNNDQMSEGTTISESYQLFGTLGYNKRFGASNFSALLGYDQSEASGRNNFVTKTTQIVKGIDEYWAFSNDPAATIVRNPQYIQFAKRSYFGRLDYDYKNKYFIEFTGRYDASSNFAPEHRWGFFPTVGLGWKISDEKFMRNIAFINNLKFRATLGLVGDDRVANRLFLDRYTQSTGVILGSTTTGGLDPTNFVPNPAATWEKTRTFNVGLDATVFKNKINFSVDVYQRYTYDAFATLDGSVLPITTGLPSAFDNYGKNLQWGTEFSVGYRTKINKDWGFNADVNFGWSNSQLLQNYYNPTLLGLYGSNGLSNTIGKDPRTFNSNNYGYIATGIIRTQAEVDAILAVNPNYTIGGAKPQVGFMNYKDVNGDGKIEDNDVTLMYDRTSAVIGFGITLGVTYKTFKLQTNLNLSIGGKRFYDSEARKAPTTTQSAPSYWADTYSLTNTNAKYPRADAPLIKENSTFWAVNGTQSRINNMVLSYSVPKKLIERYKIPECKLVVTGTNLWNIINPLKYKDPYTSNFASYPTLRTISVGLNVGL